MVPIFRSIAVMTVFHYSYMTLMSNYFYSNFPEDHTSQVREGILIQEKEIGISRLFHNTFQ